MSRLLGISIQNFGVLKNVRLGRLADDLEAEPLGAMTTFIGPNGTGKSTIVGVFEFLADCFNYGVFSVCSARNPGGFSRVCSQGSDGTIRFELFYEASPQTSPLTYQITFNSRYAFDTYVYEEKLIRDVNQNGKILFHVKEGNVLEFCIDDDSEENLLLLEKSGFVKESSSFQHMSKSFQEERPFLHFYSLYSVCSAKFLSFLRDSYLCRFSVEFAPGEQNFRLEPYLNRTCSNLYNVAAYLNKTEPSTIEKINQALQTKIPNFDRIEPITMANGQNELAIYQKSSSEPLYSANASDGTLKLFAYYLLLNEVDGTTPRKLVCIEEPENGLYHTYLPDLACDIALNTNRGRQIFVTTHSPYFVDVLRPRDVWVLSRGADGFAQARRASDFPLVNELIKEEIPLGDLWHNEYLED